jgi:uncharacterized protein (DUF362 family)/Pyruvate/2-oxoacid:ferredoxin oxidoreductase delta subunit
MSAVALVACPDYRSPGLEKAVLRSVELAGGLAVRPGDRVLVKPNLLGGYEPAKRVTTDPAVLAAVCALVRDAGARPVVADSPALAGFLRAAEKAGLAEAARRAGAELAALEDPVAVEPPEPAAYHHLELARLAVEADAVVNLPKLKTHCQMLLTLGVKNLFGCVVAQRKAEWHYMAGMDREDFASLLLDVCRAVSPVLTVLDGVWGMEGRGPSNGRPVHLGLVAAAADPLALDLAVCDLLGVARQRLPLFRAAVARGLVREPQVVGDGPADFRPASFELPELDSLGVMPGPLNWLARRYLVSRPTTDSEACRSCGECAGICPAGAVEMGPKGAAFDYERCIRCYCCQEVCPADAIGFHRGPLQRLLARLGR